MRSKSNILLLILLICLVFFCTAIYTKVVARNRRIVKVGILHSLTGPLSLLEIPLYITLRRTIDAMNGYSKHKFKIVPIVYDTESKVELFQKYAELLSADESILTIFGCWTSQCRKAIIPILEKYNQNLYYPLQFEGNECCKNIFYMGAPPNQQIDIGAEYAFKVVSKEKAINSVYLIGSDYVYPRTANIIIKRYIGEYKAKLVGETYVPLNKDDTNYIPSIETATNAILELFVKGADPYKYDDGCIIFNTINGVEENNMFYSMLYDKFLKKAKLIESKRLFFDLYPIFSFSMPENQLKYVNLNAVFRTYSVWNYLRDMTPEVGSPTDKKTPEETENEFFKSVVNDIELIGDPTYHSYLSVIFFADYLQFYGSDMEHYDELENDVKDKYAKSGYDISSPDSKIEIDKIKESKEENKIQIDASDIVTNRLPKRKEKKTEWSRESLRTYVGNKLLTPTGYLFLNENHYLSQPAFISIVNTKREYTILYRTPGNILPLAYNDNRYRCNVVSPLYSSKYITV